MQRLLFAAVLAGLALLIPVVMGLFSSSTDPPPADSEFVATEPAGDPVSAEQPPVATEPLPADLESTDAEPAGDPVAEERASSAAEPADDSIRIMSPTAFYRSSELIGKVLLPERTDAPHDDDYTGQTPFVGPQACAECHRGRVETFLQTSHARASQSANGDTVMGSSQAPRNRLATRERQLHYRMDTRPDGLYQTAVVDGRDVHSERMDLIFGSGKMGQSYFYWRDDELFQLPVSYLTAPNSWMNSPGYPDGVADFKRPVSSRCLECHATWFDTASDDMIVNHYSPEGFVLGVTCERCHGPADRHVTYHQANPDGRQAHDIVHPGRLPRDRLIDVCRQCHGGRAVPTRPAFSFRPGEVFTDYYEPVVDGPAGVPGVHTNDQLQRLSQSRCFQQSPQMSCITCHNPHQYERGNDALFATRCQQCHEVADCALEPQIGSALGNQCTQCHMSKEPLLQTPLRSASGIVLPEMFDHYIRTGVSDRELEEKLRAEARDN